MASRDRIDQARLEGMQYALDTIRRDGIEAMKKDLAFRSRTRITIPITQKDLTDATQKIKMQTLDTVLCLAMLTLHDEFGIGQKRGLRFLSRFEEKTECLAEDYASWADYIQIVKDEMGIDLSIRWNR